MIQISDLTPIFDTLPEADQNHAVETGAWTFTPIHHGKNRLFRGDSAHAENPVALKIYADRRNAEREFAVLHALRDSGINLAPEALALKDNAVIMTWIEGDSMQPPAPDDSENWHRMMAAVGASGELHFVDYTAQVPMQGHAFQNPRDVLDAIEQLQTQINAKDSAHERLAELLERMREQVAPDWIESPPIGLCRNRFDLHDLIWNGHHLLAVDWEHADWGDMAAEIGLWSSQPAFESIAAGHWVWFRWEFARLTKDQNLIPRATTYARLAQVWWAARLTLDRADTALRDRYLARAEKIFR
ncbi:MAG TPA: aminoglycoside phosphotransferase family protein [Aggregatilineales bacterium]|nr:aminoglycoside phosphotransferase family protein [Aggregatilineales bacterium]